MKKFKGVKTLEELIKCAESKKYKVDTTEYNKGSDFVKLLKDDKIIWVNTINGQFFVYDSKAKEKPIATHRSALLDSVDWYADILDTIYVV